MFEGLDTLVVFALIAVAITLWQMFTDSTATRAARVNYHPEEHYGE